MLVRLRIRALALSLSLKTKNRNAGIDVMVNTSERAAAQVFGLSLTAVFVGLLILNGISY
jgi:hypothetical protein